MALRPNLVWSAARNTLAGMGDDGLGDLHLVVVEIEQ